ncbi:MAG TPA: hypothetical protein VFM38_09595, partial [Candidatus Limnocylindrales bacterium]|nr:hypothetical protein [Candidatus Limnocylindrales bacterium]
MSASRAGTRRARLLRNLLLSLQVFLIVFSLVAPAAALAADPSADPSAAPSVADSSSAPPSETPTPSGDPSPAFTPDATSAPTPDPADSSTPVAPTERPTPTDTPAATSEPTPIDAPPAAPTYVPNGAPSIASDKDDYAPGELVTLTGSNWYAGESVRIVVNDDWGSTWNRSVDVTADATGHIADSFNLPSWFVAVYSVAASGSRSGLATTSFTDGSVRVRTVGASTAASISWVLHNSTDCSGPSAGSGSIMAATSGNGTDIAGGATASQSFELTAGAVSGFVFSGWSNGSFTPATGNPTCLTGSNSTQNTQVHYTPIAVRN